MKKLFVLFGLLMLILNIFALTIVDDAGRLVTINKVPQRVVSAAPNATKFLISLGVENTIVGVTDWDSFESEKIGNLVPLNIEKILSLNPDLVITFGGFQLPEVEKLEKFGLKVLVLNPLTLNDIAKDISLLGAIFDKMPEAKELSKKIQEKIVEFGVKSSKIPLEDRPTVFFTITTPNDEAKELWTAGTGSYINELITIAGGVNITAPYTGNNGWLPINWEFLIFNDPDVIIIATYGDPEQTLKIIKSSKIFGTLKAVKNGKILIVDGNEISQISPDIIKYLEIFYDFFYGGN
ncbi:ABC transporter substrate-binding protein [Thermosipho atlanticus]|uniref:Iron complex transport system substrate-binding protein n=1 Tax=Thermosipho atlanticus DSM 15807 TaxID=1123380 RepID=A0A1M5SEY9_9BACT|nr:ABC transporter substrate-binding protein [Thermosipho atlanticus]SHH37039.1 iron complex transport system substrate-binding protein [Thermosipho atlanticus DSM 15807]